MFLMKLGGIFLNRRTLYILVLLLIFLLLTACGDKAYVAKFEHIDSPHFEVKLNFLIEYNGDSPPPPEKSDTILINRFENSSSIIRKSGIVYFSIEGTDIKGKAKLGEVTPFDRSNLTIDDINRIKENHELLILNLEIRDGVTEQVKLSFRNDGTVIY